MVVGVGSIVGLSSRAKRSIAERLLASSTPEPNCGCVLWTGAVNNKGFPVIDVAGRQLVASRVAYEIAIGSIDGLELRHRCRVWSCINPAHMEPLTTKEKCLRAPPYYSMRTHCIRGHPFEGDNLIYRPQYNVGGMRICRECRRQRRARYRAVARLAAAA